MESANRRPTTKIEYYPIPEYFDIRQEEARTGASLGQTDLVRDLKRIIYSAGDDDFSKKVNEATEKLSSALRQYVK